MQSLIQSGVIPSLRKEAFDKVMTEVFHSGLGIAWSSSMLAGFYGGINIDNYGTVMEISSRGETFEATVNLRRQNAGELAPKPRRRGLARLPLIRRLWGEDAKQNVSEIALTQRVIISLNRGREAITVSYWQLPPIVGRCPKSAEVNVMYKRSDSDHEDPAPDMEKEVLEHFLEAQPDPQLCQVKFERLRALQGEPRYITPQGTPNPLPLTLEAPRN